MVDGTMPYITLDSDFNVVSASEQIEKEYSQLLAEDFFKNLLDGYTMDSFSAPVEIQSGLPSQDGIKLIFVKHDGKLTCRPVKVMCHSANQYRNVHYQLREPLSSIFAVLPIIADSVLKNNSDLAMENLETVNRLSYRLLRNITNISTADKIISGNIPAPQIVDLSSLLDNIIMSVKTVHRNIKINATIDDDVFIKVNSKLVTSGLMNLFANSITYATDEQVKIDVSLKHNGESAVLSYSDNSKGIKDVYIEDIFKPYFSKDPYADGEADPSLGLGLFIAKTAFDQAGGKTMTSSVFGKGVKYIVNLPIVEDDGHSFECLSADFLLNRYSDLYVQLCDSCQLPDIR